MIKKALLSIAATFYLTTVGGAELSSSVDYGWYPNWSFTNLTNAKIDRIVIQVNLSNDGNSSYTNAWCTDSNTNIGYMDPGQSLSVACNPGYRSRISEHRFRRIQVMFYCYKGPGYSDGRARYSKTFPSMSTYYDASIPTQIPGVSTPIALEETTFQNLYQDGICFQGDGAIQGSEDSSYGGDQRTGDGASKWEPYNKGKKGKEEEEKKKLPWQKGGG
jgi:hypothetical protein